MYKMNDLDTIIESQDGAIKIVKFNNPKKKNALDINMYRKITDILTKAAEDDEISTVVHVLTGTGDFYSSGNDLSQNRLQDLMLALKSFIRAFILFPKTLIAIVNGPAIGIATTTLALCDLVFTSENSYFYTPFTKLGIIPEGCSTITFQRLIGERKALEMLIFNHKMYAEEALECGFVNSIYKSNELQKVWNKIRDISEIPTALIATTKKLMKENMIDELLHTNDKELDEITKIRTAKEKVNEISKSKL